MAKPRCLIPLAIPFILIYMLPIPLVHSSPNITTDQSALLSLKTRITSDPYGLLEDWTLSFPVCNWTGVTCGLGHGRVTELNISGMNLTGEIHPQIGNLSFLVSLDMNRNYFTGFIPQELAHLRRLRFLRLSYNSLKGEVPSFLALFPWIQHILLAQNNFTSFNMFLNSFRNESILVRLDMSNNYLQGNIPESIGNLRSLKSLDISSNQLSGVIPPSLANISTLESLVLSKNSIQGSIPEIGNLKMLEILFLDTNKLSGAIPSSLGNMSSIENLSLTHNNLSGKLPPNLCNSLPNLRVLFLGANNLGGYIPNSIANCSGLTWLDLTKNSFTGYIPNSLGDLRVLEMLCLWGNNFTSESTFQELSFITSLTNCRYLKNLDIGPNPLNGMLPASVGNLSSSMSRLDIHSCGINGYIPNEIGNLSGLVKLNLGGNNFDGVIPAALDGLDNLQILLLHTNRLRGLIPRSLCSLNSLGSLDFTENHLTGPIPECFGNVSSLRKVYLKSNNLSSSIPDSIWRLQDLLEMDISSNSISGSLSPQIGNFKVATYINLSNNYISGDLPNTFQGMQGMIQFSLAHNKFEGAIPDSIGGMLDLRMVDFSDNNLSGMIPKSLQALVYLEYLNVSFNQLSGEIPSEGPFQNLTSQSFMSNLALCGLQQYQVPPCKNPTRKSKLKKEFRLAIIIVPVMAFVLACIVTMIIVRRCQKSSPHMVSGVSLRTGVGRISYFDVLRSTNKFSDDNLLGKGSFGSVYKGIFRDGAILAIKVFNLHLEGAWRTFDVECEVLRNIRHRNLVKVISSCSNQNFKALVLEYMPNGSLEKWLHSEEVVLCLMQRLSIMIDVAAALEYLHHGYSTPVVHCDLKPSNILLDENMNAYVSDFGIAQFLGEEESRTHTRTLATIGYMAPEYGSEGRISTSCDVYSYGVMLLEIFTGRQPGDEIFSENMNLKNWVSSALPNGLSHIVDANLAASESEELFNKKMSCVSSVLELALSCLSDSPSRRMNMKEVLATLQTIKNKFM